MSVCVCVCMGMCMGVCVCIWVGMCIRMYISKFIRYPHPYHNIYLICTNISHCSLINYCSQTTFFAFTKLQYK